MTQQYLVGEFSLLLAELRPAPTAPLTDALDGLRSAVECASPALLPRLACEATTLADAICWTALELGDVDAFTRCTVGAGALREFSDSAGLSGYW
ncbi:MAG TPA: hypothetical protein VJ986_07500 [Gaiellaceae bacterium]|nr:hypothetical protein [Gaiellaceae bacterium]